MAVNKNYSIRKFLEGALRSDKTRISSKEFNKINKVIDKAEFHCCDEIIVNWVNNPELLASRAVPEFYQLQFKDALGNVVAETNTGLSSPQKVKLAKGSYKICLNVIQQISNGLLGSGFEVDGTNTGFLLTQADGVGVHCDASVSLLDNIYTIYSIDGSPI